MAQICFKDSFIIVLYRAYPRRFKPAEVAPDTRANVHFFGIDNFAVLRRFFFKRGDCCGRFLLRKRVYNQHFRSARRFIRVPPLNLLFLFLRKHNGGDGALVKLTFIHFVENKSAGARLSICPLPLHARVPPQSELCDTLEGRTRGRPPQGGEAAHARFGCAETRSVRRTKPHNCGVLESGKGQSMEKAAARERFGST